MHVMKPSYSSLATFHISLHVIEARSQTGVKGLE